MFHQPAASASDSVLIIHDSLEEMTHYHNTMLSHAGQAMQSGNFDNALQIVNEAIEVSQLGQYSAAIISSLYLQRARIYLRTHKRQLALQDLETAHVFSKNNPDVIHELADFFAIENPERSTHYHARLTELISTDMIAHTINDLTLHNPLLPSNSIHKAAWLMWNAHKADQAEQYDVVLNDLEEAEQLCTVDISNIIWKGKTYFKINNFDKTIFVFTQLIENLTTYSQSGFQNQFISIAYLYRGMAFYAKRNYQAALADFRQGMMADSAGTALEIFLNQKIAMSIATILTQPKKTAVSKSQPTSQEDKAKIAYRYFNTRNFEKALLHFDELILQFPAMGMYYADRASAKDAINSKNFFESALSDITFAIWLAKTRLNKIPSAYLLNFYTTRRKICFKNELLQQSYLDYIEILSYLTTAADRNKIRHQVYTEHCNKGDECFNNHQFERAYLYYEFAYKITPSEDILRKINAIDRELNALQIAAVAAYKKKHAVKVKKKPEEEHRAASASVAVDKPVEDNIQAQVNREARRQEGLLEKRKIKTTS
jgi:hypothetical protein